MQKDVLINNPVIFNAIGSGIYLSSYSSVIVFVDILMLTSVNYYA